MLLSRDAITSAVEARVDVSNFYKPAHAHVFEAVMSLYGQGEPVDLVTVAEELRRAELLDGIGGKATLLRIQAATPASANAGHYAKIVNEHALLRRLIRVGGEIAEMGYDEPEEVADTLDRAESLVFEVAERRVSESMVQVNDALTVHTRADRVVVRTRIRCHRRVHRLPRVRRAAARVPAVQPDRGRVPSRHGQDVVRARCRSQRRDDVAQAGVVLLDGDEPNRAHQAAARSRGESRGAATADRQHPRGRLERSWSTPSGGSARRRSSSTTTRTAR